jgi:Ca2+-binding EF-hand superfamily protein
MLVSLGQEPSKDEIEEMLDKMPRPLTFSAFLTGMSGHLCDMSSRQELLAAFKAFEDDEKKAKGIKADDLKSQLADFGMSNEEIDEAMGSFIKSHGFLGDRFNYKDFVDIMRGEGEEDD